MAGLAQQRVESANVAGHQCMGPFNYVGVFSVFQMILQIDMRVFLWRKKLDKIVAQCASNIVPKKL